MALVTRSFSDIITFTRASSATMFDSTGSLVYAPANLLTYSEDFGNAAWTKQASVSVATNTSVAPDGTTTGDTVTADSGFGLYQQLTVAIGTQVTQSIYIKAGTATALMFRDDTGAGRHIIVNPSTGAITGTSGTFLNFGSVSVGNGWYRIYFSYAASATVVRGIIRPDSAGAGQTFLVWGGQTNSYPVLGGITSSLSTYYPTTTAAYQAPRLDYNPATLAARGLLIEEQRTNSIRNNTMQGAVAGTPGTAPTNWSIQTSASGFTRTIVGTGTENGITYIDIRYAGTTSAAVSGAIICSPEATTQVAAASGQSWTGTFYIKLTAGSFAGLSSLNTQITERDAAGTLLVGTSSPILSSVTSADLATQRYSVTRTLNNAATAFVTSELRFSVPISTAIDFTLRIGLPQLEQGAFATSVIPTTGAAATRSADVASVNTLSPWYNAAAGTLYAEFNIPSALTSGSAPRVFTLQGSGGASIDEMPLFVVQATGKAASFNAFTGGVNAGRVDASPAFVANTAIKAAAAYATNDRAVTAGGAAPTTSATIFTIPTITVARLGAQDTVGNSSINGWLRRITYYPSRLSNAQLQALTA